jgi:hypothetical protein
MTKTFIWQRVMKGRPSFYLQEGYITCGDAITVEAESAHDAAVAGFAPVVHVGFGVKSGAVQKSDTIYEVFGAPTSASPNGVYLGFCQVQEV